MHSLTLPSQSLPYAERDHSVAQREDAISAADGLTLADGLLAAFVSETGAVYIGDPLTGRNVTSFHGADALALADWFAQVANVIRMRVTANETAKRQA